MRSLHRKYRPVVVLRVRSRVSIFISDHKLAHEALVQNGAIFSIRSVSSPTAKLCFYSPMWRLFLRNLTSEILHPFRVRPYFVARKWILDILIHGLEQDAPTAGIKAVDHFQYVMFRLLMLSYVDSLLQQELPEEKRCLTEEEMVTLCSEFLSAGTNTTTIALDKESVWVNGCRKDLHKMPYLKAVMLEGLKRHPSGHFVLPHAVSEDAELNGHLIPKNGGTIDIMIVEMGWDPKVWEDLMEFKPERFLKKNGEVEFDITGRKEF
uniref:Cytochrome P450 n=1 Tax=Kalanchoe fedtschenkoi TaxID=63787 RepID=A0A7N0UI05_KALFE